ncbi:hypothetical protein C1I95_15160 [Micromonospora craterilacus]|uniref:Uncharacterized protein n=1 Tax=Micromonospora craterilacus TaxID=1655439 RepID=A0A2W2E0W3_9ACTN|nr:hypothetical protein [Micromonospora craterilacus]PZG17612.1 hypothetical protein C1I95_15160 [Micromonospora craterilacus]
MDGDPTYRLRGVLLAAVGAAALAVGGWWWQAEAPAPAPSGLRADVRVVPDGTPHATELWRVDPGTGVVIAPDAAADSSVLLDAETGTVLRLDGDTEGGAIEPGLGYPGAWPPDGRDVLWTERATLGPGEMATRQAQMTDGQVYLLRSTCTGSGELLVVVTGARAGDPMNIGCDGSVVMTEVIGSGDPVQVSFSTAGTEPVQLEAQLAAA